MWEQLRLYWSTLNCLYNCATHIHTPLPHRDHERQITWRNVVNVTNDMPRWDSTIEKSMIVLHLLWQIYILHKILHIWRYNRAVTYMSHISYDTCHTCRHASNTCQLSNMSPHSDYHIYMWIYFISESRTCGFAAEVVHYERGRAFTHTIRTMKQHAPLMLCWHVRQSRKLYFYIASGP